MPPLPKKLAAVPQFEATTLTTQDVFPLDECLDWMREKCDPKHKRYQVIAFSLSHIDARAVGDAFTDIDHVMVPVDDKTGALPQNISVVLETAALSFSRAASAHCAAIFTNRQGYLIKGHHRGEMIKQEDGTEREEDHLMVTPRTSFPFRVTPPLGVRENYEGNEKATAEGALGSMQRTLDTSMRAMQAGNEKMQKGYETWNEHILNKLTEVLEINIAQSRQLQEAEDRKATRAIEAKKAEFALETQAMIVETIQKQVVPVAALMVKAKLGIVQAVPALGEGEADPAALIATVKALKLTPRQLGNFVADLDEAQQEQLRPLVVELSGGMSKAEQHALLAVISAKDAEKRAKKLEADGEPQ